MTVRELLARTDSRELAEWMAYFDLDPWGEQRADLRAGTIAATVANAHHPRGRFKPSDFMPKFDREPPKAQTPGDLKLMALRITALMGGDVNAPRHAPTPTHPMT
ncbi:MAG: hypothetical protein AAF656_00450 [Planctomycetota bacterium]